MFRFQRLPDNVRQELQNVSAISQDIPYQGGSDRRVLGQAGQEDRLDIMVETAVHICDRLFIFEIVDITDSPQYKVRAHLAAAFYGQTFVDDRVDLRIVLINCLDPPEPLLFAEHGFLIDVSPDSNDQLVKEGQRPVDNVLVPDGDRVECPGEKADALHTRAFFLELVG